MIYTHGANSIARSGGPTENIVLLANGILCIESPSHGTLGTLDDSTFPVSSLPVYNSQVITDGPIVFDSQEVKTCLGNDEGFTLDFWFRGISHDGQITPYFLGIGTSDVYSAPLSVDYYDNQIQNFLWEYFWPSKVNRFYMQGNTWHHVCIESIKVNNSVDERYLFVDGAIVDHSTNYWRHVDFSAYGIRMNANSHTNYSIGQICLRNGIVWTDNFTPSSEPYRT